MKHVTPLYRDRRWKNDSHNHLKEILRYQAAQKEKILNFSKTTKLIKK